MCDGVTRKTHDTTQKNGLDAAFIQRESKKTAFDYGKKSHSSGTYYYFFFIVTGVSLCPTIAVRNVFTTES